MLAWHHGCETGATELLSASSRTARPVALPRICSGTVADKKKSSRRRYRRHTRKTPDVAARATRISFGAANGAGAVYRKIRGNCERLEIRQGINWFPRADPQRSDHERSQTFRERVDRFQFWPGAWHSGASDQRCSDASARQLPCSRTHALSRPRNRPGLRVSLGKNFDAA